MINPNKSKRILVNLTQPLVPGGVQYLQTDIGLLPAYGGRRVVKPGRRYFFIKYSMTSDRYYLVPSIF